jgi:hypothetical protein
MANLTKKALLIKSGRLLKFLNGYYWLASLDAVIASLM